MAQVAAAHPESAGFLAQFGSFFLGGDTNSSLPYCDKDEDKEATEEKYRKALSHVLISLEEIKEVNENSEIVFFLSGSVPLQSIEATSLLLNHVHQLVTRDSSVDRKDFSIAAVCTLKGLSQIKNNSRPIPRRLEILFGQERSPTLLEALDALLSQTEEKDGIESDDNGVEELNLNKALADQENPPHCDCETTVDITEYGSGVSGAECLSSTSITSTEQDTPIHKIVMGGNKVAPNTVVDSGDTFPIYFDKVTLSERSKNTVVVFDICLDQSTSNPIFESTTGKVSRKIASHYGEALHTIEAIRQSIHLEDEHVETNDTQIDENAPNESEEVQQVERHVIMLPAITLSNKSILGKALKDDSDTVTSDCDTTVECSHESVNITDENASQESEGTEYTGWFNCAFDSMLNVVLGPCQISGDCDSSLSSSGSSASYGSFHSYYEETDQDITVGETDQDVTVDGEVPPPTVLFDDYDKIENTENEDTEISSDENEWWIHDVRDVETVSLTSF